MERNLKFVALAKETAKLKSPVRKFWKRVRRVRLTNLCREGTCPWRLLEPNWRTSKFDELVIKVGMNPVKLFLKIENHCRCGNLMLEPEGRFPSKNFIPTSKLFNKVRLKIEGEILPDNLFSSIFRTLKLFRLPKLSGMLPTK